MVSPLLSLMLLAGAAPCVDCGTNSGAWSPYYCPHRQLDDCPGGEVYAQTSPHRHYPARTAWMYRYTYKYGILYSRPTDFRLLYDFPWYRRGDYLPRPETTWGIEPPPEGWVPVHEAAETPLKVPAVESHQTDSGAEQPTDPGHPIQQTEYRFFESSPAEVIPKSAREALPTSRLLR